MRIGVIMGGSSAERDISLRSGQAVISALQELELDVQVIDLQATASTHDWAQQLRSAKINVAFIALHGCLGEDGCVQGMLECLRIPYTGSGVLASALCMHKKRCKDVLNQEGLPVAVDIPLTQQGPLRYPVILKPIAEGSSIGLHRLDTIADWQCIQHSLAGNLAMWMAEMPLSGVEMAVSVLDGVALPPVEVKPRSGFYDYQAKYTKGETQYFCPARIPPESLRLCMQQAKDAVTILGCSGAPRVDMILDSGGQAVILEVNTIPGMTTTSLLPKSAAAAGIDFATLCQRLLHSAKLHAKTSN
ncbi:MAG: D-alanine--D-alanine ligase [Mariprofundales bacterium]